MHEDRSARFEAMADLIQRVTGFLDRPSGKTGSGQRGRFRFAHGLDKASRTAIVNHLAARHGAKRYLEIGVRDGRNIEKISVYEKWGVDPAGGPAVTHPMTSDRFFEEHGDERFDIVFIDGMHLEEFVVRDIANALSCLNQDGHIVVHDCNPPTEFHQRETYEVDGEFPPWNGTVWRGWLKYRAERSDLSMHVVDTDYGVGVIKRGRQATIERANLSYREFSSGREGLLPLISVKRFLELY